ncbi:putative helicase senataxin [Araneus ventricosus]|uniref:Putative helicase senataxin n=1 Tax=Araneus ventricosus TaxID=182803 RepID=A0A4Y2PVC3_ARAVE|nr:putative helicase senataxin [Araneus ventricosus]
MSLKINDNYIKLSLISAYYILLISPSFTKSFLFLQEIVQQPYIIEFGTVMAMDYFLKQINPANATPLIICLDTEEVTVGRSSIVSLTGFNKVSRKHARFSNKNGRWFVRDLESLNKLYVNFKEVNTDWMPLEIGDIIGFGTPSYIEDGGLVCVFAAKNRIKQEPYHEIESSNFGTKNNENDQNISRIKDDKPLPIKQELPSSDYGDYQKGMAVSKQECTLQTNLSSPSSSMLNNATNNISMNSSDIYDLNSVIAFQNKYESYSEESKPMIKIEPNETDDNGLLNVINTSSTKSLSISQKLNVENMNTYDNSENTSTCEGRFSLKNNIEEGKQQLCKDVPSNIRKTNMIFNEHCKEVGEKASLNYSIPEKKIVRSSDKLQAMIQKAKDIREEKKTNMLFNDYSKKVAEKTSLNDSIPEKKILKSSDKLQAMLQKANDMKYFHSQMKECSVKLVRCDSNYFRWPPEINLSKLFAPMDEDAKNIQRNDPKTIQKQISECHLKRKKFKESIEGNGNIVKVALNLRVSKNRILSSSSEMSSDESEYEKEDADISNGVTSDKKKIRTKSKKQPEVEKSLDTSQRNSSSLYETSQAPKISEKRKLCFVENHSTKRIKSNKRSENPSSLNDFEDLVLHSSASASGKNLDLRKKEVPCYSRDESAFCVQRDSFCSKYWTPEYNEFETGEVQERLKSNAFIRTKQTAGRTLLTDPKPMEYRSRRMRGREEWFKEKSSYSCRDSDQNERISENINEGTSYTSTNSSKSSSGQRFVSSKEHSSTVDQKCSTKLPSCQVIASSKGNTSVSSRKNSTELFSSETFTASKEHISIVNRKFSTELPSSRTITSSKGNTSVTSRKNPTELIQPVVSSRANTSVATRKNSIELFSDEALLASSENLSIVQRKNSMEVISSASVASSGENSCMENLEQTMQDKSDNSTLIKSTAGTIRMNTSPSVPRRRNSSGCRTRFLVEIQRNADETSQNKGLTAKETFPLPSEKGDCSSSVMVKPTEIINTPAFPTLEATKNEKKNSKNMNNIVTSVNLNLRIASLPAPISDSSFEDKKQMNWREQKAIGENEFSTYKPPDTTSKIESKLTKHIAKTSDTQFSPKEVLEPIFNSSFENKKQVNWKEQKAIGENELSTHKPPDATSKIESKLTKPIAKTSDTQFLPKEVFSKNDKISNDKKVAIVSPVSHDNFQPNNLSQPDSAPYFHAPIKEKITNRVHSTYILSPIKPNSKPIQSNSDSTSVEDESDSASDAKFRSRYLIKSILQWNPKWLEEQAKNKKPPPMVSKGGLVLPLRYSSFDSYIKSFYPMISLEIWECLYRESKPLWLKKEAKNAFYYTVRTNKVQHGFMELQCESVVNENLSFLPCEGNIILLGFSDIGNGLENSLFGYINCHKVESALETEKMKEWQEVPKEWQENAKVWTFSVHIKKSKKNFMIGSVSRAYGILNIKNKLQLADALVGFKDSPIQNDILRPTKEMFAFCKSISKIPRTQLIQTVSEELKKENPHSKLILINAPVATGKTGAIIGIVEKLLFSSASKIKLLLCALSDMTVDEIGLRLVELNERCSWRGNCIKFVRFGQSENIPAKLQAYTLETKVLKMFKEQNKQVFEEREKELKVLEDKINNVLFKEQLKTNNKYRFRKRNDEALKQLTDQLQSLKDRSPYRNIDPVIHATYESAILKESDVVLATLNSCMHPLMRKFYMSCNDESHACCIIDEISQCTELEVLQCLHPEINRLVLVGDLQQLQPRVSSKYAIKWGFKRSMLERISKLFSVQFSCPPPLSLTEQHRMQSQICHFSSKYFYKDELLTAADVDDRYKYSPLKPFVVYDILEREMPNPPVNIEDNEPFVIANICAQLLQTVRAASLGVIVPHEDLAALYRIPLSLGDAALKGIEVNTVENYQGLERDIIIISCINPSLFAESESFLSCEKKMNVAITRARQTLVICGHISSMTQFEHWSALINNAKLRKSFISVSSLRQIPFVIMKTICRVG